jgi:hypothetical protein
VDLRKKANAASTSERPGEYSGLTPPARGGG